MVFSHFVTNKIEEEKENMKNIKFASLLIAFIVIILTACSENSATPENLPSPALEHIADQVPIYSLVTYEKYHTSLGCWDLENFGYGDTFYIGEHYVAKITIEGETFFFFEDDAKESCYIEF